MTKLSRFRSMVDSVFERCLGLFSRVLFLRAYLFNNLRTGHNTQIYGFPIIRSPNGEIVIGENVTLVSSSWRASAAGLSGPMRLRTFFASARIIIENNVGINGGSITSRSGTIRIGQGTMIGPDCIIMDSDFHLAWPPDQRRVYTGVEADADVTIGPCVWLGARCLVLKGVTIGENTVIAAGSVVITDIPSNCLAAGVPAVVKRRFVSS
jgi:acetyltransferase-like isoleucine patch superfamily enzyme